MRYLLQKNIIKVEKYIIKKGITQIFEPLSLSSSIDDSIRWKLGFINTTSDMRWHAKPGKIMTLVGLKPMHML